MANANKSLLRCELEVNQAEITINKLLNPKPKFEMPTSKFISKLKDFIPEIAKANELLNDKQLLEQAKIDDQNQLIKVKAQDLISDHRHLLRRTGSKRTDKKYVNMDLFMGLFDVTEPMETQQSKQANKLVQEL